ncbi:MAG: type II secretion system F family protein [Candidatus Thioglobus sp.]|nr:MAG: type II secretion system F family protein [Candidatus Thioglobus sp.]
MFDLALSGVYLVSVLSIGAGIALLAYLLNKMLPDVVADDRTHMDPLPAGLKVIWPLILMVSILVENFYTNKVLDQIEKKLQTTGVSYILTAEQFVALRFVAAMITLLLSIIIIAALNPSGALLILSLAALGGYMFPLVWLSDTRKRREIAVIRALPVFLDFTTMAVEAGLNLSGALQQAMIKGPDSPLRNEFAIVMRDLRSGVTRSEALKRMAQRLDIADINTFVNAMVQAEKMGSSMATALRIQSEQRRTERFQRAEKVAMEAPVKLIFPLIMFIFPVTFIVLGFPIAMKFLDM